MGLYIKNFNKEVIALFFLSIFSPHSKSKTAETLYNDIVYTLNLDAIPASYDIKYTKDLPKLDEQYQQLAKQQLTKGNHVSTHYFFYRSKKLHN